MTGAIIQLTPLTWRVSAIHAFNVGTGTIT